MTLDDLVEGRLSGERLALADEHLDACAECSAVVTALANGRSPAGSADGNPRSADEPGRGDAIGRYLVLACLGRGAAGAVYEAYDPKLDRKMALKLLRPGVSAAAAAVEERMRREAQAMARLAHPNVVAVFDVGHDSGRIWLAMELVAGATLRRWGSARRRSWREVRDVFTQAGRGLSAAHDAGLVHRDFKPENVLVGDDGRVRVTDFGLARHVGADPPSGTTADTPGDLGTSMTATGALLGTPAYMAPEQLAGEEADAASDQFAFAVALHEALHGRRPYPAATLEELRRLEERHEPIRSADARTPRWLDQVVLRALSPRRIDRFPSMRALLAALEGDASRRRVGRAVASVVLLAATAAGAMFLARRGPLDDPCGGGADDAASVWGPERARGLRAAFVSTGSPVAAEAADAAVRALDGYTAAWVSAHRATCRATRITHEQSQALLDARMQCLQRGLGAAGALASRLEHADRETVARAAEAAVDLPPIASCSELTSPGDPRPADPAARAELLSIERALDELRAAIATGKYATSLPKAREQVAAALGQGYRPAVAEARLTLATLLRHTGDLLEAGREAHEALWTAEAAHDDRTAARAWLELCALAGDGGTWTDAEATARHASAAVARLGDPSDLRAAVLHAAGVVHTNLRRFDEAARELDLALALRRRAFGEEHIEVARTLTALGNLARARGELERALELHGRARAIDERLLGAGHPAMGRHLHNIAGALRLLGRHDEAMQSYEAALVLEREGLGEGHPAVGITRNSMGLVRLDQGDTPGARAHFEAALAILERAGHPDRAAALQNLGIALAQQGLHVDAIARFEAALAIVKRELGDDADRVRELQDAIRRSQTARAVHAPPRKPPASSPKAVRTPGTYLPAQTLDVQ